MIDPFALARELVAIPSTTDDEARAVDDLARRFAAWGLAVRRIPVSPGGRDDLLAAWGTRAPRVLLSTHVDTVPPHVAPRVVGDTLFGRGACDAKGILAAMCAAVLDLAAEGIRDVGLLVVVGEERGHAGAIAAARAGIRAERLILGEPTQDRLVVAQKGIWSIELEAAGVAAHSGYPARGRSAIDALLDALERIRRHAWPTDPVLGPTTVNIGTISGGEAPNVLAARATARLLFRAVGPLVDLEGALGPLLGPDVRVASAAGNPPWRFDAPDGFDTTVIAFNTDGPYLAELGPAWLVGPGDIEVAHTADERITRGELEAGAALYARLCRRALQRPPGPRSAPFAP